MNKQELKSCPFCGGEAIENRFDSLYWFQCEECCASTKESDEYEVALKAWNTREQANEASEWDSVMKRIEEISKFEYDKGNYCFPRTFGMINEKGQYMFRFNRHQLFEEDTLLEAAKLAIEDFNEQQKGETKWKQKIFKKCLIH